MFELFVVACIAGRACEYITIPIAYESEERCRQQGAVVAGMVRGRYAANAGFQMNYDATCRSQQTAWLLTIPDWVLGR